MVDSGSWVTDWLHSGEQLLDEGWSLCNSDFWAVDCSRVVDCSGEARVPPCSWASSNISSNLTQLPSQSLQQGLCLNLWPHIDQHPMASEGLNTQQGLALGQSGHQACCPATLSA